MIVHHQCSGNEKARVYSNTGNAAVLSENEREYLSTDVLYLPLLITLMECGSMSSKNEYEFVYQEQFKKWDDQIDAIMHKIEHAEPEVKADLNGQLEEIHLLRQQALENQHKLEEADESAWEHLKEEIEEVWEKIEKAVEKLID